MVLTGQAKKDFQRGYMRKYMQDRRAGVTVKTQGIVAKTQGITVKTQVIPKPVKLEQPRAGLSANQLAYIRSKAEQGSGQ